jgi:P27 family predicted phage terminase small subunit
MRGRKPTPIEVRQAEGNPGHRPLPAPVVIGGKRGLEPPKGMPSEAKKAWESIVPTLEAVGVIDTVDAMALEAMCVQWARHKEAGRVITAQGHMARGSQGQPVEHPALASERNAAAMFLRFAEQYALTPVARTRLGLAELHRRTMATEMADRIGSGTRVKADD